MSRMEAIESGVRITDSLVERYGLFVIIVLGEVVVGVAQGPSEAERNPESIATRLVGLMIRFASWWTYFDFVGRRLPLDHSPTGARWLLAHLPVTMSVAAAGAAMVSLIEHAGDPSTPAATAWLLSGSVAFGLLALVLKMRTLRDFERFPSLFRPVSGAMLAAAAISVGLAWWVPVPWLLAALLVLTLAALWFFAVSRWLSLDDPDEAVPESG